MSYTTNTTANRLKITKGWKNPSFPEILPLYSRDNIFFFKLYLFLKAYFTLKRTKLIYCDLRTSENYTKILYLVINSLPKKRKRKNTFPLWFVRPLPSGFKYSKFRDAQFRNAVNLIYLDLPELKKQVSAKLLPLSKQKVNAAFYKKPRFKTWINFLAKIKNVRKKNSLNYKRNLLRFVPILNSKLNVQQSLNYNAKRLKNEITILNNLFRNLQQKKALTKQNITFYKAQLLQLQKKFAKLQQSIAIYKQNSVAIPTTKPLKLKKKKSFNLSLNKRAAKKTQKLRKRYEKLLKFDKNRKKKFRVKYLSKSKPRNWKTKIKKALLKTKKKLRIKKSNSKIKINMNKSYWKHCIKKANSNKVLLGKIKENRITKAELFLRLMKTNKAASLINNQFLSQYKNTVQKKSLSRLKLIQFILRKKEQTRSRIKIRNRDVILFSDYVAKFKPTILSDKEHKRLVHNVISVYANYLKQNSSTSNRRTFSKLVSLFMTQSLNKFKFNFNNLNKNFDKNQKVQTKMLSYPITLRKEKSLNPLRRHDGRLNKFRFSLIKNLRLKKKREHLTRSFSKYNTDLALNLKNVSSLIKNFKKMYKNMEIKLKRKPVWKFRETFRKNYKRHTLTLTKYQYKLGLQNVLKKYFKMDFEVKVVRTLAEMQNLKFFRLKYQLRHHEKALNKKLRIKKLLRKLNTKERKHKKTLIPLRERYMLNTTRANRLGKHLYKLHDERTYKNTYVFKNKANKFKRIRNAKYVEYMEAGLSQVGRRLLIRQFMPIASMFVKFLDPQLVADHIAKELERTKNHRAVLYCISQALRVLPFARGKGYRVLVSGRINATDKSRSFMFKRNVLIRQNFSSRVNFASSQARARIGSFGIKVWVFY